jgi:predicted ATPase
LVLLEIHLTGFKCFGHIRLPLHPLTLLTGVNGGGKSTILQALVLLHQGLLEQRIQRQSGAQLPLNGSVLALGTMRDVIDKSRGGRKFSIGLNYRDVSVTWDFTGERDALAARLANVSFRRTGSKSRRLKPSDLFPASLLKTNSGTDLFKTVADLTYVPADRVGPCEVYPLLERDQHRTLGVRAERAVGLLYWRREEKVLIGLRHPNRTYSLRLDRQVEAWFQDLFPGASVGVQRVTDIQGVPTANLATLVLRTSESTGFHRPQHVGFGMTHVLPILIALLSAQPGALVVVENPETHLHPRAQARIADLCARAAASGIQVLLETHSDHVLNSARIAVHRGKLAAEDIGLHFFGRNSQDGGPAWTQLHTDSDGRIRPKPLGFFDEIERQLGILLTEPKENADDQRRNK